MRPHRNVTLRPEIRDDGTPGDTNVANNQTITPLVHPNDHQWVSGIDCVLTL